MLDSACVRTAGAALLAFFDFAPSGGTLFPLASVAN